LAVRPRRGPPLAPSTRQTLYRLKVQLVEKATNAEFAWEHFSNKVHALLAAEATLQAQQYIWLDSDVLMVAEPDALWLRPGEDFAACVPDSGALGSTGPADSKDDIWQRACGIIGIAIDSLPWVTTLTERMRIRFYINGGVFTYRRGSGFAEARLEDYYKYLRAKMSRSHSEVHFLEQLMLGLTVHRLGLRWRLLPHSCNYGCYSKLLDWVDHEKLAAAQILHYHDMMDAEHWPVFCDLLEKSKHPLGAELLRFGPLANPSRAHARAVREVLRVARGIRRRVYYRACGFSW
jgi:hypothetical protein